MTHLRAVPSRPDPAARSGPRSGTASTVRVVAPGKVNLFLSCGAPGADGYHPLTTVFQAVRLIETVTARRQSRQARGTVTVGLEDEGLSASAPAGGDHDGDGAGGGGEAAGGSAGGTGAVPLGPDNLAVRAAELLAAETGVSEGVDLLLRKRVPVAGGMAGGSADAAAALVACNQLWGTGLDLAELSALASRLGADVPFPLIGSTAVGHGRGDRLTPLMTRGSYQWVFALARRGLSTPEVFAHYDRLCARGEVAPVLREVPEEMTAALRSGDARALAATLANDLQPAALSLRPELSEVISLAERAGALRALVCGSGPTVAALVEDAPAASRVSRALSAHEEVAGVVRADAPVAGARVVG